jgi:hypothetical protein
MMGVVGSLPLPLNTIDNMQAEHSLPTTDENNSETTSVISDERNTNDNQRRTNRRHRCQQKRIITIKYGPLSVKIYEDIAPTLATRRRSNYTVVAGEDVVKREIRRRNNRQAVERLRAKRENVRSELQKQVRELEFKQNDLKAQVEHLRSYKQCLETKFRQTDKSQL